IRDWSPPGAWPAGRPAARHPGRRRRSTGWCGRLRRSRSPWGPTPPSPRRRNWWCPGRYRLLWPLILSSHGAWGPDPCGVLRPIHLKSLVNPDEGDTRAGFRGYIGRATGLAKPERPEGADFSAVQDPESVVEGAGETDPQ